MTIQSMKRSLSQYVESNSLADLDGVNDDKSDFWDWLNQGSNAETTHIKEYDRMFKWKYGWVNSWTGYSNEGKSSWLYFLILIKLLQDPNAKVAVFSPENYPRHKFVKDWVKTMLGCDPKYSTKVKCDRMIEQFNDRLFYVYPSNHDIESIENQFKTLIKINKVEWIDSEADIPQLKKVLIESKFSKIPVFNTKTQLFEGYIHHQSIFKYPQSLEEVTIKLIEVNINDDGYKVLNEFIQEKKSIATVLNDDGKVVGIITLEDILERIFGAIEDEHDE